MSSGSWLNHGGDDIGTTPNYMGPWEKLQLGWLDFSVVNPGEGGDFTLSPAALQVDGQDQALVIDVPDQGVTTDYVAPNGGHAWWTSSADDLNTTLTRTLDLGRRNALIAKKMLWQNGVLVKGESLGGTETRTVSLSAFDGRVQVTRGREVVEEL